MKKPLLLFLFVLMTGTTIFGQNKEASKKPIPPKEDKKSLPKRVYKSWMKIKSSDENSSLTTKVFSSILKTLKESSGKEE